LSNLPAAPPEITLNFRRDLLTPVFQAIRAGRSCAVVGVSGAGLSNTLRFMAERRVIENYLNAHAAATLPVYLETDLLTQPVEFYRRVIKQISRAAEAFRCATADQRALAHLCQQVEQAAAPDDWLAKAVTLVCRSPQHRLILIFDEFDRPFVQLPATTLRHLRELRDDHKGQLCYLVGTSRELTQLARARAVSDDSLGKFTELFDADTYPLTPYNRTDAHALLVRKTFAWPQRLTSDDEDRLYRLTGGHAKLLTAVLRLWEDRQHLPWGSVERAAQQDQHLRDLCAAIWDDLEPIEQFALWALATDRRAELRSGELDPLRRKGLIVGYPPGIFAILFEAFVKAQGPITRPAQPTRSSPLRDLNAQHQW
jgi:hypothetical protein